MAFIITGDTHGTLDIEKVIKFFTEHEDEFIAMYDEIVVAN